MREKVETLDEVRRNSKLVQNLAIGPTYSTSVRLKCKKKLYK